MPDERRETGGEGANPRGEPGADPPPFEPASGEASGAPTAPDQSVSESYGPSPGPWRQPGPWQQAAIPGWQARGTWQEAAGRQSPHGTWQPGPWPGPPPGAWAPGPVSWPIGVVPWGYANPPTVVPVLEAPGNFHPPTSARPPFSLKGRASPRLYLLGLVAGLPGIAALLLYLVGYTAGFKLAAGPLPSWLLIEAVSALAAVGLVAWAVAQARQRRADGWLDYNGPSPWLTLGAFVAATTAIDLPIEAVLKAQGIDLQVPPAAVTLLMLLTYLATYIGLVHLLAVRTGALTWRDIAGPRRLAPSTDDWGSSVPLTAWTRGLAATVGSWRSRTSRVLAGDILVPLALVLPLLIVSNLLSAGMLFVLGLNPTDISPDTVKPATDLDRLLVFITVGVVAPIGEEIFFRGFATNAWGRSISRNSTILRASLFFAFVHVMNTVGASTDASVSWRVAVFNFGARIPVAFALTWLYMRRRSILASGTLHAGYNGLIALISFF